MKPNILLLFCDQHKASVAGFENHPDVLTPHLDRLAAEGVRFSRAYCQDAVCVPSRSSFFSGLYPRTLGCLDNNTRSSVMKEAISLQSALRCNGYQTAAFGKRHLYLGCDEGWDTKASHLVKESPTDNYVQWIQAQGYGEAFDRDWAAEFGRGAEETPAYEQEIPYAVMSARESQLPNGLTMEGWTKRRTIEFLKSRQTNNTPFFCFASFYRPHQPYTPLPEYYRRFDRTHWGQGRLAHDGIAAPPTLRQPIAELPPEFQQQSRGENRIWRFDLARQDEQLYRDSIAAYYALVEEIDDHVGAILQTLEETGQRENTIVIYASDHGDFVGAHGMMEKCARGHNIYEETLRVPLIVSWPKSIPAGRVCDSLVELVDVYPTLLDLCGLPQPETSHPLQGLSQEAFLRRGEKVERKYSVSENEAQATVITEQFKLGVWQEPMFNKAVDYRYFGDMLFDRKQDPLELQNLTGQEAYREIETELRHHLSAWQARHPLPKEMSRGANQGA